MRKQQIWIFLNEYYFGNGLIFSLLRLTGGPLVTAMGSYLYFYGNTKPGISYAGFMIAFGTYYTLKPFLLIFTQKSWFRNFDLDYRFEPGKIIIKSEKSSAEMDYSELAAVLKRKNYFAVRMNSKQALYLPIKFLAPAEINILERLKNKGRSR